MSQTDPWPDLPLSAWNETCETLHRWTQVVGKIRMVLTPLVNHWWNVTLYVTSRGLTTSPIPYGERTFEIAFDFIEHRLMIAASDGATGQLPFQHLSVAGFYDQLMERLASLGISVHIWTMPSEIENAVPFDEDFTHASYDPHRVKQFCQVLQQTDRVLKDFRARFIGKVSPVHFFWGGFDLAVTRFSGRPAPRLSGSWPNVPERVMQEAYSHEVSSCGFWPGNGGFGKPAFYVYAYPEPAGYGDASLTTAGAAYDRSVGQFILPYDAVRKSSDPDTLLLGFFQETYERAANLAGWDRPALERI